MDYDNKITFEQFFTAAKQFCEVSDRICDGWKLHENPTDILKSYLRKHSFISHEGDQGSVLYKAEFVIYYNLSYGVPSFSFNLWNASGVLVPLDEIRQMSFIKYVEWAAINIFMYFYLIYLKAFIQNKYVSPIVS